MVRHFPDHPTVVIIKFFCSYLLKLSTERIRFIFHATQKFLKNVVTYSLYSSEVDQ